MTTEERLTKAGFVMTARAIARGQNLWERDDEPNRSFLDEEALAWLVEQKQLKKKKE